MFNKQKALRGVSPLRDALVGLALLSGALVAQAQNALALPYRNPANPLTVAELAALQRKKLEQDYYKKAGFSTATPQAAASQSKPALPKKPLPPAVPAKPRHVVVLMAVYGPAGAEKAELRYDGQTHIAHRGTRMGLVTVESLAPGVVGVLALHAGRSSAHTLRPGDSLEVSE